MNTQNYRFHTPLALAIFEGYLDIVDVLVKHGADVNLTDDDGDTALHHALTRVVRTSILVLKFKIWDFSHNFKFRLFVMYFHITDEIIHFNW